MSRQVPLVGSVVLVVLIAFIGCAPQQPERLVEVGLADTVGADEYGAGVHRQEETANRAIALDRYGAQRQRRTPLGAHGERAWSGRAQRLGKVGELA